VIPLVFLLAAGVAAPLDAPPDGLTTSTAHLSEILAANQRASGHLASSTADRSIDDWSFTRDGQTGTEHLERSGTDYVSRIDIGPFEESFGQFNGVRWHRDYNGFTSTTLASDDESFAPLRVFADLVDPKNDLSLQGETTGAKAAYVIEVKRPQYKHPEWVFVDKSTSLVTRVEWISGKRRVVNVYDDYRTTDGHSDPWHIHDSDGRAQLDYDWHRTALVHPPSIDAARFAPPPSTSHVLLGFDGTTALPAQMHYGEFIVRVSVGGRGLDFLIDSASPFSIIDREVAHDLNLLTFGAITQLDDGTKVAYTTRLDDATVGPLRFQNFVLQSETYNYRVSDSTKVVGILGYDFLANFVLHIDYTDGTLELIPKSQFQPSAIADSYNIPLLLDNGKPMVSMGIGEAIAPHVILDTASPFSIISGPYIDAHNTDFVDLPYQEHRTAVVPFADDSSYGQTASLWFTTASHMRFGPSDYQRVTVIATNFPFYGGEDATDAILGIDYLSFFDVYLDYADKQVIIKPNKRFYATFHKNN
jgi:hypothetical protein